MNEELHKYYIPKSFIKKEIRYNFLIGLIIGACISLFVGAIILVLLSF